MDGELVAHFVAQVRLAAGGECDASSAAGMLRLELLVHERLMQLGRKAVQDLATEVGSGYQGPRVKRGGVVSRFKGNRPRTVHGLYGPVTVQRAYYASDSGDTWVPLDRYYIRDQGCLNDAPIELRQFEREYTVCDPIGLR